MPRLARRGPVLSAAMRCVFASRTGRRRTCRPGGGSGRPAAAPCARPWWTSRPLLRAVVVELVEHVLDLAAGDVDAQVVAGDGFDRVGLVEDHDVVVGQDAHAGAPQGDVAEEQRVIDDQDLRVLHRGGGPCSRSTCCTSGSGGPGSCRCRWRLRPTPGRAAGTLRSLSEPSCVDLLHLRISRSCASCSSSLNRLLAAGERRDRAAAG